MIERPLIDEKKCTLCGKCEAICPKDVLKIRDGKILIVNDECMLCSHCYAVCAFDAVDFPDLLEKPGFISIDYAERVYNPGDFRSDEIINIFRSRRSMRKFRDEAPGYEELHDLVEFAVTSPSGSNCQDWCFTILNGREKVWNFAQKIRGFFVRLNRLAGNPLTRILSIPFMGMTLVNYYRNHFDTVKMAIAEGDRGRDLLFHGAPSVIIIHSPMEGSTPVEDGTYAAYNICMLAHYMGLGTCLIGFAVEAVNRGSGIKNYLNIPEKNRVHAVIALGKPDAKFLKLSLRKRYSIEFI